MDGYRFGCGHVTLDPEIHEASWGARLIYSEVIAGSSGVVYDRQTPDGDPESVRMLFPVVEEATRRFREDHRYALGSDSRGRFCWRDGRVLVTMSPQGSYGYLYVTAVMEREGHEGETRLAAFETDPIPEYGNWPPRVVEAREQRERERARAGALHRVKWAEQELRWAKIDRSKAEVRHLSQRTMLARQRKVEKAHAEVIEARLAANRMGITDEEISASASTWW